MRSSRIKNLKKERGKSHQKLGKPNPTKFKRRNNFPPHFLNLLIFIIKNLKQKKKKKKTINPEPELMNSKLYYYIVLQNIHNYSANLKGHS